jgi:hypothetical protein
MAAIFSSVPSAARDPDTDPARTAFSADPEMGEGRDQPFLEITNIAAQICSPAPLQIEHHVSDPLARSMVGELAARGRSGKRETALGRANARAGRWLPAGV